MSKARNTVSLNEWEENFWKKNFILFHKSEPNRQLLQFYDKLNTNPPGRIFLPLCGKSVDMVWLADKGHEVVGLEFSETAIKDFFKENKLEFTTKEVDKFVVYKVTSKNISIYQGDFFCATRDVLGEFDNIWDRGSFVAIDVPKREKYATIMNEIMRNEGRYLIVVYMYDETKHGGPPHFVTDEQLQNTLGQYFECEMIDKTFRDKCPFELDWLSDQIYLLKKKN